MKQRILMAAAQEMNERGVKFTVDAVAARLGISKKTFYEHYRSKDELIATLITVALEDEEAQEAEILAGDMDFNDKLTAYLNVTPQIFGKINEWVIEDIRRLRPDDWNRIERYHREKETTIRRILDEGIASGHLRPVNTYFAAHFLMATCKELLDYQFLQECNLTLVDAVSISTDIFLKGIIKQSGEG